MGPSATTAPEVNVGPGEVGRQQGQETYRAQSSTGGRLVSFLKSLQERGLDL